MLLEKEFSLLYYLLHHAGAFESQRDLATKLCLSLGNVNNLLKQSAANGWIADKRLTLKGEKALAPYRVDNAVIMAAGSGTRLAPLSYDQPKGLLVVKGELLIERQIRQLQMAGIKDITVVVGYMKEKFFYLAEKFNVKIVTNSDYYRYNNTSTLMCVLDSLKNTYICSSDNYFVENVFEDYVYQPYYAAVKTVGKTDEYCLTFDRKGKIISVVIGGQDSWYMLGQAYFSRDFSRQFQQILQSEYQRPITRTELWENVYMRHLDVLELFIKKYPQNVILEFDSLDELRKFDEFYINNVDSAILRNICRILKCNIMDIRDIKTLKKGMTNLSFVFSCKGKSYVYRHPGNGTDAYINRKSEAFSMKKAAQLSLDATFIYMDETEGWKISHYIPESHELDYANKEEVAAAMRLLRRLHQAQIKSDYDFDVWQVIQDFIQKTRKIQNNAFDEVTALIFQMEQVSQFAKKEGENKILCHCDAFNTNFLVGRDGAVSLIDWEYSGNDDPALDVGIFLCCAGFDYTHILEVIDLYLGHRASVDERQHFIAYAALASFYCYAWAVYQESLDKPVGEYLYIWYNASKFFVKKLQEDGVSL